MASDSRYIYHTQEVASGPPYPYPYPPPPYENGQYAQGSSRPPLRSPPPPQAVQHPPQTAPYSNAPPPYPPQPGYPPSGYGVPPPHPQQWQGEWSHYSTPYPSAPPPSQQPAYPPPAPRPEVSPNASNEDRRYAQQPQRPEPRRTEDRPPQRPEAAPPPNASVRKTRDNDHPTPGPIPPPIQAQASAPASAQPAAPSLPAPSIGIDFAKLLESYRLILDTVTPLQYDPNVVRPPAPPETLERMLQAATYGAQVFDAAAKRAVPEPPRAPIERAPDESDGDASRNRQSENGGGTEGQTCLGCSATSTPEWRRGPMGPRTLCNACGLVYAKLIKKRNRDGPGRRGAQNAKQNAQATSHPAPADDRGGASSGEGSGDDDDSYGSQQDRQSDLGYRDSRE